MSDKCEFCGRAVLMSTFGLTCLECDELPAKQNRIRKLEAALERIRDCNWPGKNADILSQWEMRQIAREALE